MTNAHHNQQSAKEFTQKANALDFENCLTMMQLTQLNFQMEKLQLLNDDSKKALQQTNPKLTLTDACLWGEKARLEATKLDWSCVHEPCRINAKLECCQNTTKNQKTQPL